MARFRNYPTVGPVVDEDVVFVGMMDVGDIEKSKVE